MAELTFDGFPKAAFAFYEDLADNNDKAWFEAHRETFETAVRAPMTALFALAAEEFSGTVKISRPHRDVRFSKDKSPYKTNLFAVIHSRHGPSETDMTSAGLYAAISAEGLYAGTGYYEMSPDQLGRYRDALGDGRKAKALKSALDGAKKTLDVRGRALKTAPKGFARDHPEIELLRMKEIVLGRRFEPKECTKPTLADEVFATWRSADMVNAWLDRHVGAPELSPEERFARR